MRLRQSVQSEVLLSLAMITFTATALLLVIFLQTNTARLDALHPILARGFLMETRLLPLELRGIDGAAWWHVDSSGHVSAMGTRHEVLDPDSRQLGERALAVGSAHVQSGAPWDPLRLAAPDPRGDGVLIGRIREPISGTALGILILVDMLVFGLFGFTLLNRRVVGPIRRLAAAVRATSEGEVLSLVPVEGAGEIAELGTAFNEMQSALATRTGALEQAVEDLRAANLRLSAAREGLDRAERLAMVGSLAAGVAHEVGNPMAAMLAFMDVAARDQGIGGEARHCLERASEQGERVRVILRQLLDFSRPPRIERAPVVMEEIAAQVVELVSAQQEYSDIEFEIDIEPGLEPAQGDPNVSSQILLNLVLNAAAALEKAQTRRIRLSLRAGSSFARAEDLGHEWSQRRHLDRIYCWVEDSGPGVVMEDPGRIFDPFFTTKAPGKGTGLGLANALRLAREMGGEVELDDEFSALGGARFGFMLKRACDGDTEARDVRKLEANQSRIS